MHLEGRDVPDGPKAHRITGSQHMGLQSLQEGAGDERSRAASIGSTGATSTEGKGRSDTAGVCTVINEDAAFTWWTCMCEFSSKAVHAKAGENSKCTLAERNMLLWHPWRMRQCTYMMTRTGSIINGDNHQQQHQSILSFVRVEQCYIFNVLVILIKIMSLPLSPLILNVREVWAYFGCLIDTIQCML